MKILLLILLLPVVCSAQTLMHHYTMNDDESDAIVVDDGTEADNAELAGGENTTVKSEVGQVDDCLHLNGSDDYIDADDLITTLAAQTSGSVTGWFYVDADGGTGDVLWGAQRNADSTLSDITCDFDFAGLDSWNITCRVDSASKWVWSMPAQFMDDKLAAWHHYAVVHNGTSATMYFDGLDVTATGTFSTDTDKTVWFKGIITDATNGADTFSIGCVRWDSLARYFLDGKVDDFRVWSVALTAGQIGLLYEINEIFWFNLPVFNHHHL